MSAKRTLNKALRSTSGPILLDSDTQGIGINGRSARQRAAAFGRVSGKAFYEALLCWARCSSKECFVKRLTRNSFCRVKHFANHATLGREIQV
jgi:hypothetical protein